MTGIFTSGDLRRVLLNEYQLWIESGKDFSVVVNRGAPPGGLGGFIVHKKDGWRTVFTEMAEKLSDVRKWTGLCGGYGSRMRVLGFDMFPCELPLPDFTAVKASNLAQSLRSLGSIGGVAAKLVETLERAGLYRSYSREQSEGMQSIVESLERGDGLVILDMPTGSGKTESFLIPAIANALSEGLSIIVYPRKALASNQLERIVKIYLALRRNDVEPPFLDVHDGDSCLPQPPYINRHDRDVCYGTPKRLASLQLSKDDCKVKYTVDGMGFQLICGKHRYVVPATDARLETIIGRRKPHIVITNYDMLNRLVAGLQAVSFQHLLREVMPRRLLIVFDEAHEFQGVDFEHLLLLLARIYDLALAKDIPVVTVFSSATLPQRFEDMMRELIGGVTGSTPRVRLVSFQGGSDYRTILVTMLLPEPQTAGQWLAQLAGMLVTTAWEAHPREPVPQAILFVDSLRYLRQIAQGIVKTLYADADSILRDHVPAYARLRRCQPGASLPPELDWSDLLSRVGDPAKTAKGIVDLLVKYPEFIPGEKIDPCNVKGALARHYANYQFRKKVEEALTRPCRYPRLIVATSTLEMGVDLPAVNTIIQFRRPMSEASNMQRLGRVARRSSTLYTGLAVYALTSTPKDALLLLDSATRSRYFYGCTNLKGNKPTVNAPVNITILKQHLFLHALALGHNTKQLREMLGSRVKGTIRLPDDIAKVEEFIKDAQFAVNSAAERLNRIEKALRRAYTVVDLTDTLSKLTDNRNVKDIISEDLEKALKKVKNIKSILETICQDDKTKNIIMISNELYQQLKELRRAVEEHRDRVRKTGHYGPTSLVGYQRIAITDKSLLRQLWSSEDGYNLGEYERILSKLLSVINTIIDSIDAHILSMHGTSLSRICSASTAGAEKLKALGRGLLELSSDLEKALYELQDNSETIDNIIARLKQKQDMAYLLQKEFFKNNNKILEKIEQIKESIEKLAAELSSLVEDMIQLYSEEHISAVIAELVGEPYFKADIRSTLRSVAISYNCARGKGSIQCEELRQEEPIAALYRLTPLSESPSTLSETGFHFMPPFESKGPNDAYFIALSKSTGYFVGLASYAKILEALLRETLDYPSVRVEWPLRKPIPLLLGDTTKKAFIYQYSSLASIIEENLRRISRDGKLKEVRDARYVAFKARIPEKGRQEEIRTITVVLRLRDDKGNPVRAEGSVSVGLCLEDADEPKIFLGIDVPKDEDENTSHTVCPLAKIWYELWRISQSNPRAKAAMDMLGQICSRVHTCGRKLIKTEGSSGKPEILVSDILTYLVRTFPIINAFIRPKNVEKKPVSITVKGNLLGLETYKASVELNYNWVRLNLRFLGDYIYSLPVRMSARMFDTYVSVLNVDENKLDNVIEGLLDDIARGGSGGGQQRYPLPARIVLVKTILAALGSISSGAARKKAEKIKELASEGRDKELLEEMENIVAQATRVLERAAEKGESYTLTMSSLAEATRLLLWAAVEGWYTRLYDALSSIARSSEGRGRLRRFLKLMSRLSIVHMSAYGIANVAGYDDVISLSTALLRITTSKKSAKTRRVYALVEQREGGIGYLPTLKSWGAVAALLSRAYNAGSNAMQQIIDSRKKQAKSLQPPSKAGNVVDLLRRLADRVEEAYGARGSFTYLPAWLVRIALTYNELKEIGKSMGYGDNLGVTEREWSRLVSNLLPAFFDADFVDANEYHLAGVNSWLGDYEKRILLSFLLAQTYASQLLGSSTKKPSDKPPSAVTSKP